SGPARDLPSFPTRRSSDLDYVASVVSAEVPSSWPKAALEAQAVAARTFAMAQKVAAAPAARAHLGASVLDQVYGSGSAAPAAKRSEEHTSELQSPDHLVCR